jgi:CDP-4-dehydro-6-deoxyglucose reductase, E3
MQQTLFRSEVAQNQKLSYKFRLVKLKLIGNTFSFIPGQFITLKVNDSVYRCYSLFSSPSTIPYWEIFVDISPGGPGTTFIKNLKKGDIIETTKPSGVFTCKNDICRNIIFAAVGCGFAPLKAMVESKLNFPKYKIFLLLGLRYEKDIVLKSLLDGWSKNHANFSYEIILSQPGTNWKGKRGYINASLISLIVKLPINKTSIYISGNNQFVGDTLADLSEVKFPENNIHSEHL